MLAGVAILFLKQADEFVVLAAHSRQVVIGELAPPFFGLALYLLPLAFEDILVHCVLSFGSFEKLPKFAPALWAAWVRRISGLSFPSRQKFPARTSGTIVAMLCRNRDCEYRIII